MYGVSVTLGGTPCNGIEGKTAPPPNFRFYVFRILLVEVNKRAGKWVISI